MNDCSLRTYPTTIQQQSYVCFRPKADISAVPSCRARFSNCSRLRSSIAHGRRSYNFVTSTILPPYLSFDNYAYRCSPVSKFHTPVSCASFDLARTRRIA